MDRRQKAARRAIRAIIKQAGGVRRAERELKARHPDQLHYPSAGLLTQISKGERRPQPWLCDLLDIPVPERKTRTPVPWKKVAKSLAIGRNHMIGALVTNGIEHTRAEEIATLVWG